MLSAIARHDVMVSGKSDRQFWCRMHFQSHIICNHIILMGNWLWVCEQSLNMGWGTDGLAWQQAHYTCANPLGQIIDQHSHVLDIAEWAYEEARCHLAPQYQGPFSPKQINQRVKLEGGTVRVIVTMCWICGHMGDSGSVIHVTWWWKRKWHALFWLWRQILTRWAHVLQLQTHQSSVTTENIH